MKQFQSIFRQLLFWMLFFAVERLFFLLYQNQLIRVENISFFEVLSTFFYALKLDLSTACYILIFPFLLLVIQSFVRLKVGDRINKLYTAIIFFVYILINNIELGLFSEWHTKLTYKALIYLQSPGEIIRTVPTFDWFLVVTALLLQTIIFYFVYTRYFYQAADNLQKGKLAGKLLFVVMLPSLLFIGIRGGFSQIPITASQSYFSGHDILNLAAVNSGYNIAFSILNNYQVEDQNVFKFMPDEEAKSIVSKMHLVEKDTTIGIINQQRPNIVIIFIESWSGDLIESLGGKPGITPGFHALEKEGLLFNEFYASGNRSQQALASVFAGLPAIPITTLTDYPEKYNAVPSLIKILNGEGYYSSFFFGGDLNYGNIKSYLIYNDFDRLVDENQFPENAIKGKLGVHDEGLFDKMLEDIDKQPEPFFTAALTLSSHSPYDQPGERPINWIELENKFVNSAWYTDKCLGDFFREAKKKDWYKNTLFIVLSDHSHPSYNNYQWWSFDYRHIPLLFLGGALSDEFKNTKNTHLASNMDLPGTLLNQMNLDSEAFFWSKNMLNPYSPQFAYFELNDGFGWKTEQGKLEYNVVVPLVLSTDVSKEDLEAFKKEGEAYIQVLLREFLSY